MPLLRAILMSPLSLMILVNRSQPAWNPLDIGATPADTVILSAALADPVDDGTLDSPMLAKLSGIIATLKGPAAKAFRAAGPGTTPIDPVRDAEHICYVHLSAKAAHKTVELAQTQTGAFVAFELKGDGARGRPAILRADAIAPVLAAGDLYTGSFDPATPTSSPTSLPTSPTLPTNPPTTSGIPDTTTQPAPPAAGEPASGGAGVAASNRPGETSKLEGPYFAGWFILSQETLGDRLLNGGNTKVEGMKRVLATQEMWVRLPKGYTPRRPAGLVVWIDPTDAGRIPAEFDEVLDELNLIGIGAASMGNQTPMGDRLQLAFDGIATATRRFHADTRRLYVTGVSGGGRLSSLLAACFPDVITGSVPIVGVSCYENLPTGVGGFWAGGFRKPPAKLFAVFKKRPMAPMTGGRDFNLTEIQKAVEVYQRDGCLVRLFEYQDLAHTVPSTARLAEAFAWVDKPAADVRASEARNAAGELAKLRVKISKRPLSIPELSKEAVRITKLAPWSAPAWEVVELLRSAPAATGSGSAPAR